jgi:hypothetical protein
LISEIWVESPFAFLRELAFSRNGADNHLPSPRPGRNSNARRPQSRNRPGANAFPVANEVQGKVAQLIQMETLEKCTSIAWEAMEEL